MAPSNVYCCLLNYSFVCTSIRVLLSLNFKEVHAPRFSVRHPTKGIWFWLFFLVFYNRRRTVFYLNNAGKEMSYVCSINAKYDHNKSQMAWPRIKNSGIVVIFYFRMVTLFVLYMYLLYFQDKERKTILLQVLTPSCTWRLVLGLGKTWDSQYTS